jgi:VIT1/CCC1 family predicted Fe2+/Mn2+ transporter
LFELGVAIWVSIAWGFSLLGILSYVISRRQKNNPIMVITEHFFIAALVIFITHEVGSWISSFFG